jgi:hypothetical protein
MAISTQATERSALLPEAKYSASIRIGGDRRVDTLCDGLSDRLDGHRSWSRGSAGIGGWLVQVLGGLRTGTG